MFELVYRYTNRLGELKDKLTTVKSAVAKMAESDVTIITSLWKQVNLLHKEIYKIGKAFERVYYLRGERETDVEKLKEKLLQAK